MGELRFEGRVAVVTGAGGGLGRAYAVLLAARGAQVVVNDVDQVQAVATVDAILAAGGTAIADSNTVSDHDGGEALICHALGKFGRIDIVVNNAGFLRDKAFHNLTPELIEPVLDVHLMGAFWVTRPAWVHMREQGYGRVVNITSSAGLLGNFGQTNYAAAKMGLVGLTRALAVEGAVKGIQVNAVAPLARTAMTEALLGPLGDQFPPELVAPVVAWLCHEDCPANGEIYSAGGGRVARFFIGLTPGWHDSALTPESVRDNFEAIGAEAGYSLPASPADELAEIVSRFS
ncbi:MAG TPA: SDR family NAD(P)-dependent oxidoreductase [Acidimicrobiales bacterium]|nr:SDR family NAD(P)-dependent oxidoreductase [Acidimicrobiales bacterium]